MLYEKKKTIGLDSASDRRGADSLWNREGDGKAIQAGNQTMPNDCGKRNQE